MTQSDSLIRATDRDSEALAPKQAHLIRSAYRVMGEKGMNGLSLQDVADEAGVSKAILPYYFDSKENLTLLTMRWVLARVAQRIREAIAKADTAEEKISAMIDAISWDRSRTAGSTSSSSTFWATRPGATGSPTSAPHSTSYATASTPRSCAWARKKASSATGTLMRRQPPSAPSWTVSLHSGSRKTTGRTRTRDTARRASDRY